MNVKKSPKIHDVLIIGSGAAGGMVAWNLTRKGVNVCLLDAGAKFKRSSFWSHVKPWENLARLNAGQRPPQFVLDKKISSLFCAVPNVK